MSTVAVAMRQTQQPRGGVGRLLNGREAGVIRVDRRRRAGTGHKRLSRANSPRPDPRVAPRASATDSAISQGHERRQCEHSGPNGKFKQVDGFVPECPMTVPYYGVARGIEQASGGVRARSVMLRVRARAARTGFCPTAVRSDLRPRPGDDFVAPAMRLTLLEVHGRTVAIAEDTPAPGSLAQTGAVVRSIRFG
jgi:hypothetical protein